VTAGPTESGSEQALVTAAQAPPDTGGVVAQALGAGAYETAVLSLTLVHAPESVLADDRALSRWHTNGVPLVGVPLAWI
jgi:hypothetical protein